MIQIICVFFIVLIKKYLLQTILRTIAPKDVLLANLLITLRRNVFQNVPLYPTTPLLKIHPIYVWNSAQLEHLVVHKIYTVWLIVGGLILKIKLQDFVYKHVQMNILLKIRLLFVSKNVG